MSPNDDGPVDRALEWILAVALVAGTTLKWLLLWPYEVATTYLAIGEKRREAAEGGADPGPDTEGPGSNGDDGAD